MLFNYKLGLLSAFDSFACIGHSVHIQYEMTLNIRTKREFKNVACAWVYKAQTVVRNAGQRLNAQSVLSHIVKSELSDSPYALSVV